jgi:hypothetical protein
MAPAATMETSTTMEAAKAGPAAIRKRSDCAAMIEAAERTAVHA